MALTQVSTGGIKDGQVQTADLADGQVTVGKLHADALDHTYTLGADGSNHYTFTGEGLTGAVNDPTLYLTRGKTYRFVNGNSAGAHPFRIQTTVNGSAGTEYNTGVTNNGGAGGSTIIFEVPHAAPDVLYYQCTSHGSMGGIFYITGALADGGVTTAKIADNAVTMAKLAGGNLPSDINVTSTNIANGTLDTDTLADDAVTADKLDNSINSAIAANTAKDLTALSASNLTSGTVPDARFPATLPAVSAANLTDLPKGRAHNIIINGAMKVAQRGTSSTGNSYQTVDRMSLGEGGLDETCTQSQISLGSSDVGPYAKGFRHAYRIQNGNQTSGVGATDFIRFEYRLEAQDIATSGWDYTNTNSKITLQFWVRSSVAQNFYFILNSTDGGQPRSFPMETSSLSAGAWTKITKTIPGDSSLQFDDNINEGLTLFIYLYLGTNYTNNGVSLNNWRNVGNPQIPVSPTTWFTTNDATWDITGLQLEVGDSASDFEHKRFSEDLALCQRYFIKHTLVSGAATAYNAYSDGYRWWVAFPTQMRDTPNITTSGGSDGGSNAQFNVIYKSKEGYTARIESTTTSSKVVWWYGATVLADIEIT